MSNPQQPELGRSRKTPAQDQDAVAGVLDGQREVVADAPRGPGPAENQAGQHPAQEQDKPDIDAFAEKLGTMEPNQRTGDFEPQRQRADGPPQPGRRGMIPAAAAAALVAVVLVVVAGRRRRSRRSR